MSVGRDVDTLQLATEWVNKKKIVIGTGLLLPTHISADEHTMIACFLGQLGDVGAWGRGDQVVRVQDDTAKLHKRNTDTYNDAITTRYTELLKLYRTVELKTILNNAATARTWPLATRRQTDTIGYGHHETLNSLTPEEREYYLDMADAGEWTVARLRHELWTKRGAVPPGASCPEPSAVAQLFQWAGLKTVIEPRSVAFTTPQGTVICESESPITWRVER